MPLTEELPIPTLVTNGEQVTEMARIWLVDGDQVVTISPRLWSDPGTWGLMLVDLAKHISKTYARIGIDQDEALNSIKQAMSAEWASPTAED